jgi:hypothetical protein
MDCVVAIITAGLAVATLVSRQWIELFFGVNVDGGSGVLEIVIVVGFAICSAMFCLLGRLSWKRQLTISATTPSLSAATK